MRGKWVVQISAALLGALISTTGVTAQDIDAELDAIAASAIEYSDADPSLEGEDWELMAALSRWLDPAEDERIRPLDRLQFPAPVSDLGATPQDLLASIETDIALVPYAGSMRDAATLRDSGSANTMDRAQLLAAALVAQGFDTRLVAVPVGPNGASVTYADSTPTLPPTEDNDLIEWFEEQAALGASAAQTTCARDACAPWLAGFGPNPRETVAYWPQYQSEGAWIDLRPSDIALAANARPEVVDDAAIAAATWTLDIRLESGSGALLVDAAIPAAQVHARTITFLDLPNDDLATLVPTLVVGPTVIAGDAVPLVMLDSGILATVTARGPGTSRQFTRTIVPARTIANDLERMLETAAIARITLLTAPLSQEEYALGVALTARSAAHVLFEIEPSSVTDRMPPSLPALSVLDAVLRTAGHVGVSSRDALSFQVAPAIALEVEGVITRETGNSRAVSFDILDAGHGLQGADERTVRDAAFEQAFVDGAIEAFIVGTSSSATSLALVSAGLAGGAAFSATDEPPPVQSSAGRNALLLATVDGNGRQVGFRLDAGPQVLLTLDGRGGVDTPRGQASRLETLCGRLEIAAMFVPGSAVPPAFLIPVIARFQCKLAQTVECAASALDRILNPDAGAECDARALEDMINSLGEDFAKDLLTTTMTHVVVSAVVGPAIDHIVRNVIAPAARWVGGRASRFIANRVIGRGSRAVVREAAEGFATKTYMSGIKAIAREMKDAGWSKAQRKEFFQKYGCFLGGTLIHTPDGSRPIEDIAEGDLVYAYNFLTGEQVARRVIAAAQTHPDQCVSIRLSDGSAIETTPDHRFYEARIERWVDAELLQPGSQLLSGSKEVSVTSIAGMACAVPAYSITVEADANFFVGEAGILVHNDDLCQINRKIVRAGIKEGQSVDDIVKALRGQTSPTMTKEIKELVRQARIIKDGVLEDHPGLILPGTKTIAVSPSHPEGRLSGYANRADVDGVLAQGKGLGPYGYTPRSGGFFDPKDAAGKRVVGLYNASHAEKQLNYILGAKNEVAGISKFMCGDCLNYFRASAISTGRDIVMADPYGTYFFRSSGQYFFFPH